MNNTIKKAHLDGIHFILQREKIYHEYDINELTITLRGIDMTDVLLAIHDYQDEYISDLKQELNDTKKKQERWHYPSKGELPNEGNLVFVAGKNQNGYKWTGCLYYREDNYDERTGFYDDDSTCFDDEVYAWKYLPEPPKEIA